MQHPPVYDPRNPRQQPRAPSDGSDDGLLPKPRDLLYSYKKLKLMTSIWVDSRKRVAGTDADFEFDVGQTVHLQGSAKLSVFKIRVADTFLSTDRGSYLYWRDQALGTLNWAQLPTGAYTGARLAAWISSNFATATYVEQTKPYSELYLRCSSLANAADTVGPLGHDIIAKIICNRGVGYIMESSTDENHQVTIRGPITLRYLRFRLTDIDGNVVNLRGTSISFCIYLDG